MSKDLSCEAMRMLASRQIEQNVHHFLVLSKDAVNEIFKDNITYQEYFALLAENELKSYFETLKKIAKYDPFQKQQFTEFELEQKLDTISMKLWNGPYFYPEVERRERLYKTIEHLMRAIENKLSNINLYQSYYERAKNKQIKSILSKSINREKSTLTDLNCILLKHIALSQENDAE